MGSNLSKKAQERIQTARKNKSTEINLSECQLKKLPHVVRTSLKNLTVIRLSHNYLTFIPPSIANFVDLEELYLDTNELENLPKELFTLQKLRVLNIAHNRIAILQGSHY
jgi:Leucine-rich repeat (LRR) protein